MKITDPKWRTFKRNKKKLSVIESAEYDFARVWINAGEKPNLIIGYILSCLVISLILFIAWVSVFIDSIIKNPG